MRLTQAEIADRAGLGRGYYSQLENSRKVAPPARTVDRIADALKLEREQRAALFHVADMERRGAVSLPPGLPLVVVNIMKKLLLSAEQLPACKLRQIEAILAEDRPM